jgi:excinuclease ABC subunit C
MTIRSAVARLPGGPGVYRFRDAHDRVLYIGRASNLRQRVGSYWSDLGDRRHLHRMVPQIAGIEAVPCDSAHEAAWLERNLLERAKPRWNRVRGGAEVPMCIRVERTAGAPRLVTAHWPLAEGRTSAVETFGPYLGGNQVRLAVSALDRVLPMRYTDDRLGGCERDLARVRGVAAVDRDAFLATVVGALRREPHAVGTVRDLLARQRDRASENLAFELAARIQQEIEAVDWIVAAQKVTRPAGAEAPAECEVYGWNDGLLVHFRVSGGRLCRWEQRDRPWPAARRYLDRTPAAWSAFASRAAELGRRLAGSPGS